MAQASGGPSLPLLTSANALFLPVRTPCLVRKGGLCLFYICRLLRTSGVGPGLSLATGTTACQKITEKMHVLFYVWYMYVLWPSDLHNPGPQILWMAFFVCVKLYWDIIYMPHNPHISHVQFAGYYYRAAQSPPQKETLHSMMFTPHLPLNTPFFLL